MESSGAIIDRVMREQQKQIQNLQQQNKQLINALQQFNDPQNWVEVWDGNYARLAWNGSGTPMHFAAFALKQIQGNK